MTEKANLLSCICSRFHTVSCFLQELSFTRHVSEAGLARETDLYFMGVVERGTGKAAHREESFGLNFIPNVKSVSLSARLHAAVVLSPRYPEISPLFSLSLNWKGERSGRTDDNLRVRAPLFILPSYCAPVLVSIL